jgi:hypothetical protein
VQDTILTGQTSSLTTRKHHVQTELYTHVKYKPKEPRRNQGNKIRQPNFGRSAVAKHSTSARPLTLQLSEAQWALNDLKNLECTPRHSWTDKERYDLAVLFRFFEFDDVADLSKVFNKMHNLDLDAKKQVKPQEKWVRDNIEAFPFCLQVYNCPVQDPSNAYASDRAAVLEAAHQLGIHLQRRHEEPAQQIGSAKHARSDVTRERFERLMQSALSTNNSSPIDNLQRMTHGWKLGGVAIPKQEVEEFEIDLDPDGGTPEEATPPQVTGTPRHRPQQPTHLGFRVWDMKSYERSILLSNLYSSNKT